MDVDTIRSHFTYDLHRQNIRQLALTRLPLLLTRVQLLLEHNFTFIDTRAAWVATF